jgi:flagellar motor switch protein FliN/FliY
MTNTAETSDRTHGFVQLWSESLSLVLAQISGTPCPMGCGDAPEGALSPAPDDLHLLVTLSGKMRGELALRISPPVALALAKIFMGGAQPAEALTEESRSALEELFRQVAGYVVTAAKPAFHEINLSVSLGPAPSWPAAASRWIYCLAPSPPLAIEFSLSAALTASLEEVRAATPSPAGASHGAVGTLDFFMDLELGVTLRFGGRDVLLKEVLELGPGSVLELDREIHDPADLLLDGKLIARGEVVLVNGNYGLRVSEVLTGAASPA